MVNLPLIISVIFTYRSELLDSVSEGFGPESCPCGKSLRNIRARRRLYFLGLPLWSSEVNAKRCDPCRRYFVPVNLFGRWCSPLMFTFLVAWIWTCLLGIAAMFLVPTFSNMLELDGEILLAWMGYALVAGVMMYFSGRAAWRRLRMAATTRLLEVDQSLGKSV